MTSGRSQGPNDMEERILAFIRDMSFLDKVYFALYFDQVQMLDPFKEFSAHSVDEIKAAIGKAQAMRAMGIDVGQALMENKKAYDGLNKKLRTRHPGFGEQAYNNAIDRGCFLYR